jgi:hypothetical protein
MTTTLNTPKFHLKTLLDQSGRTRNQKVAALATLMLGVVEALSRDALDPTGATVALFNAENCIYVHRQLKNSAADEIMSRGVQLTDLFDILPPGKAKAEFAKELEAMRRLSVGLLRR